VSKSSASAETAPASGVLRWGAAFPLSTVLPADGAGGTEVCLIGTVDEQSVSAEIFCSRLLSPTGDLATPAGAGEAGEPEREKDEELYEGISPTSHVEYSPPDASNPIIAGSR
jgi:hypothetical protein